MRMHNVRTVLRRVSFIPAIALFLSLNPAPLQAQNQVMGEVAFEGKTHIEKNAGVWVDGIYVGYLKELKGNKKVLLLPGQHEITVRSSGYTDFVQNLTVEPGEKQLISVRLHLAPNAEIPKVTSALRLQIKPERAAVFVDGHYAGHAEQFSSGSNPMLVSPGKHRIKVELPGYQTFETEINLLPEQKSELKTELVKGSIAQASTLIKEPEQQ